MPIPSPGDTVSRPGSLVPHYGIVIGPDQVLDIVPGAPPRVVTVEKFAAGYPITVLPPRPQDVPAILARARRITESRCPSYHPVWFNCEHLKNLIASGKPYSETVQVLTCLTAVVAIGFLLRGRGH